MISVALEGNNGCGKTTTAAALLKHISVNLGLRCALMKRPMPGGKAAAEIEDLYAKGERGSPRCEELMREDAWETRRAAESLGVDVAIWDRDVFSQYIYGGVPFEDILAEFGLPDIFVGLYAPARTCLRRIASRPAKYKGGSKEAGCTLKECAELNAKYADLFTKIEQAYEKRGDAGFLCLDTSETYIDLAGKERQVLPEVIASHIGLMVRNFF